MVYLKSTSPDEVRKAVQAVEDRSDDCWKLLRLLNRPRNVATWALLTGMALELELTQQKHGADSLRHRMAMICWDRCTCGFSFIVSHGKAASRLITKYNWNGMLIQDAQFALRVTKDYTDFLNIFPLWHKDWQRAEVLADGRVHFIFERDSPQQRRVVAYQQIFRPSTGMQEASKSHRMDLSADVHALFDALISHTRSRGLGRRFEYQPPPDLIAAVRPHFRRRLDDSFRHPASFQLGGYSLGEFKIFYVEFLTLCGIHEYICYPWKESGHPVPESSLVMVKPRNSWISQLTRLSGLPKQTCDKMVADLTLDPRPGKATGMSIHPFVPLDSNNQELAVAPQFPLAAKTDDNILRAYSYTSPGAFSAENTQKEDILRRKLLAANGLFNMNGPIDLPDGSTDIDFLIEDAPSSALVFAELKWIRKPLKPRERLERDADVDKGIRQLKIVRNYARAHPDFLKCTGRIAESISSYAHVYYLLVICDHWFWVEPEEGFAVLDFLVFLSRFAESANLQTTIADLLTYSWLPVEGQDFRVDFLPSTVNGAVIESPTFMPMR
jgi:hypothetical protein